MQIKTERLTVRRIEAEDWQAIRQIWIDFGQSAYAQYDCPHPTGETAVQQMIRRWADTKDSMEHLMFAVCTEQTVIGYIVFHHSRDTYETGYCFHSDYHGRGYAKESFLAALAWLKVQGITQITAGTALKNTPSVALLKSLGFVQTGTERVSFYQDEAGSDIVFEGGIFCLTLS